MEKIITTKQSSLAKLSLRIPDSLSDTQYESNIKPKFSDLQILKNDKSRTIFNNNQMRYSIDFGLMSSKNSPQLQSIIDDRKSSESKSNFPPYRETIIHHKPKASEDSSPVFSLPSTPKLPFSNSKTQPVTPRTLNNNNKNKHELRKYNWRSGIGKGLSPDGFIYRLSPVHLMSLTARETNDIPILLHNFGNKIDFVDEATKDYKTCIEYLNRAEIRKSGYDKDERLSQRLSNRNYSNPAIAISDSYHNLNKEFNFMNNQENFSQNKLSEPIELVENKWNIIHLQLEKYSFLYIMVKGRPCPLNLKIKTDNESLGKFSIYMSRNVKHPSKMVCDQEFDTKSIKIYDIKRSSKEFTDTHIYFGIMSQGSGTISAKFTFDIEDNDDKTRPQKAVTSRNFYLKGLSKKQLSIEAEIEANKNANFLKELEMLKEKRRQKALALSYGQNKIEYNRKPENFALSLIKELNTIKRAKLMEHYKQTIAKKQEIDKDIHAKKAISAMKTELKKAINVVVAEESRKIEIREDIHKSWFIILTLITLMKNFDKKFQEFKKHRKKQIGVSIFAKRLTLDLRYDILKKGLSPNIRHTTNFSICLNFITLCQEKYAKQNANKIVFSILTERAKANFLCNKISSIIEKVTKIQRMIKNFWLKKTALKEMISFRWERLFPKVMTDFKKNLNGKIKIDDDIFIDEAKKHTKIEDYYQKCWQTFVLKFSNYLVETSSLRELKKKRGYVSAFKIDDSAKKSAAKSTKSKKIKNTEFVFVTQESQSSILQRQKTSNSEAFLDLSPTSNQQAQIKKLVEKIEPPRLFYYPTDHTIINMINDVLKEIYHR